MTEQKHRGGQIGRGQFVKTRTENWTPETWDDGWTDVKGYFHVYRPDHPNSNESGFIFRYHVVWWLATGEVIKHPYLIHHINEIRNDDRIENLRKMLSGEHTAMHNRKPLIDCACVKCGNIFQLPQWRINQGRGRYCSPKCYERRDRTL